jgi:hypothetical protein
MKRNKLKKTKVKKAPFNQSQLTLGFQSANMPDGFSSQGQTWRYHILIASKCFRGCPMIVGGAESLGATAYGTSYSSTRSVNRLWAYARAWLWREGAVRTNTAAVSDSKGDLGLVPAFAVAGAGAWWNALEFDAAPKIIARLPFVDRADHPAALPVFVVSRVADSAMVTEVEMWSVRVSGWNAEIARALSPLAEIVAVPDTAFDGAALLVSVTGPSSLEKIRSALIEAGASVRSSALVGSHATRYTVPPNGAAKA